MMCRPAPPRLAPRRSTSCARASAALTESAIATLTACGDRAPNNDNEADAGGAGAHLDGNLTEDAAVTPCGQDADCPGNGPCLVGVCDAGYCTQQPAPDGTACDDGDACTQSDGCSAGACGGSAVTCDDGDACTLDICDSATGCSHAPVDCDNENPCTTFACEPDAGCVYTPLAEDTPCAGTGSCVGGYCQRDGQVLVPRSTFWTFCAPETDPICADSIVWSIPSFEDTQELVHGVSVRLPVELRDLERGANLLHMAWWLVANRGAMGARGAGRL